MPQLEIQSSSGPAFINYTISTPLSENSKSIDPSIPTVLFFHPMYIAQAIFHFQFASPKVRRFNLIGFDSRCHGETIGSLPPTYRELHAAEDAFKFMEALHLPPCHLVGLAVGGSFALQTAISYPHKVLSLFMISPLGLTEPKFIADVRQEIFDCWVAGRQDENPDQEALIDAISGAVELGFNRSQSSIVRALVRYTLPQGLRNWSPDKFQEFQTVSLNFFVDRKSLSLEILQKVKFRVHLVHCDESITYPLHCAEELKSRMENAGLDVLLSHNPGAAFFGTVDHPEPINDLIHDWVMNNTDLVVPPAKEDVTSPYAAALAKFGYVKDDEPDEDDLLITVP